MVGVRGNSGQASRVSFSLDLHYTDPYLASEGVNAGLSCRCFVVHSVSPVGSVVRWYSRDFSVLLFQAGEGEVVEVPSGNILDFYHLYIVAPVGE